MQGRLDRYLGEEQFGFRKGRNIRCVIGLIRIEGSLTEKCTSLMICLVDLEKALGRVN